MRFSGTRVVLMKKKKRNLYQFLLDLPPIEWYEKSKFLKISSYYIIIKKFQKSELEYSL